MSMSFHFSAPLKNRIAVAALMVTVSLVASAGNAQAQGAPPAPEKKERKAKDQAEEDLLSAIKKEQDSSKKITLLKEWKERYPASDYKSERLLYFLDSYAKLGDSRKTVDVAKEILRDDPQNTQAILGIAINVFGLNPPSRDDLSLADRAGTDLLANLDSAFSISKKPAYLSEPAWKQTRIDVEGLAHAVLGWVAMQRKENDGAEQQFREALQKSPHNGQVSYWLGTMILAQKKPGRYSDAIYHLARAAAYDGLGSLPVEERQRIESSLIRAYNEYHGEDAAGLAKLKELAKQSVLPPSGFEIAPSAITKKKEN